MYTDLLNWLKALLEHPYYFIIFGTKEHYPTVLVVVTAIIDAKLEVQLKNRNIEYDSFIFDDTV